MIILPGSKNTLFDLRFLHEKGFAEKLNQLSGRTWILGICGGFQMLGEAVEDPNNMESSGASGDAETSGTGGCESGLGLLPMTTVLEGDKKLVRRRYKGINWLNGLDWSGYEIHLGRTEFHKNPQESFVTEEVTAANDSSLGVIDRKQKIIGTYIHGLLESPEVTQKLLALLTAETFDIPLSFQETKEREMDELALFLEEHCEVEKILAN